MKRREEENLINLAFGEYSEEEARRMEASAPESSKAGARLAEYRRLKSDLRLLEDIPEPQISKERIREAILRGGLKKRNHPWSWAFIATPAMAVLVAAFFVINQPAPEQKSMPAAITPKAAPLPEVAHLVPPAQVFSSPVELTNANRAAEKDYSFGDATPMADLPSRHSVRRYNLHFRSEPQPSSIPKDAVVLVPSGSTISQLSNSIKEPSVSSNAPSTPDSETFAAPLSGGSDDSKIVVVHDAQDQSTGTEQATEVDRTANVLVGG